MFRFRLRYGSRVSRTGKKFAQKSDKCAWRVNYEWGHKFSNWQTIDCLLSIDFSNLSSHKCCNIWMEEILRLAHRYLLLSAVEPAGDIIVWWR